MVPLLSTSLITRALRLRLKDKHARWLSSLAGEVNFVWNYCNETSHRTMLQYKCDDAGVWFHEVDERFSTQACNHCHALTGPRGREGVGIRQWTCSACSTTHDRDINAARNIKARGLIWLEKQFSIVAKAQADIATVSKAELSSLAEAGHGLPDVGILGR